MDTEKIAVDIALIPPDEILQLAIDINKTFPETVAENYVLDTQTCIPHITLVMGLVEKSQLPEVIRKLDIFIEKFSAVKLKITHMHTAIGINTYLYDNDKKDLEGLKLFLDNNCN
jgi:hypothetical protein